MKQFTASTSPYTALVGAALPQNLILLGVLWTLFSGAPGFANTSGEKPSFNLFLGPTEFSIQRRSEDYSSDAFQDQNETAFELKTSVYASAFAYKYQQTLDAPSQVLDLDLRLDSNQEAQGRIGLSLGGADAQRPDVAGKFKVRTLRLSLTFPDGLKEQVINTAQVNYDEKIVDVELLAVETATLKDSTEALTWGYAFGLTGASGKLGVEVIRGDATMNVQAQLQYYDGTLFDNDETLEFIHGQLEATASRRFDKDNWEGQLFLRWERFEDLNLDTEDEAFFSGAEVRFLIR